MNSKFLIVIIILGFMTMSCTQKQIDSENVENKPTQMGTKITIKPKGIYAEIDVARHNSAIEILNGNDETQKQATVDSILKNPNYFNPPVIYALSRELFRKDKKDEAAYWYYVAQIRARYDANLCLDDSAKQAVSILNRDYGAEINKYSFQDIQKLEKVVTKVVDFVRSNDEDYDHRWINLHGMQAMIAGMDEKSEKKELSKPKEKWTEIKNKTIDDYYKDFIESVMKK